MKNKNFKHHILFAFFALFFCLKSNAQHMPIEILNNLEVYNSIDTLDIDIINKDSSTYYVTVGIEKYTNYDIWEEITTNILFNNLEIGGKSKGGLSYYLTPLGRVKINRPINQIYIPILVIPDETNYESAKKYRLSASTTTNPQLILSGTFRLTVKITKEKSQKNYMLIKSESFQIE